MSIVKKIEKSNNKLKNYNKFRKLQQLKVQQKKLEKI